MKDARQRGEIVVGDDARRMATALLAPPVGIAAPMFWVTRLLTIGLLPERERQAYGFEWNNRRARRYLRTVAIIHRTSRLLPRILREWPAARRSA